MGRVAELLNKEDKERIEEMCFLFNAQWVEIDGTRFRPPRRDRNRPVQSEDAEKVSKISINNGYFGRIF